MFSALKRLVGNQNDNKSVDDFFNSSNGKGLSRSGVHPMGYQLQKEFSRGVQYNSKLACLDHCYLFYLRLTSGENLILHGSFRLAINCF